MRRRDRHIYVTDLTVGGVRSERLEDRNVHEGEYSSISVIKFFSYRFGPFKGIFVLTNTV